jgi:hypothetical protein
LAAFWAFAFRRSERLLWVDFSRVRPLTRCGLHVRSSARSGHRHRSCPRCAQNRHLATCLSSQRRTALPATSSLCPPTSNFRVNGHSHDRFLTSFLPAAG